ncbi:MAG: DUF1868 domain-containing protein [Pseudomonadota bacterium]
MAPHRPDPILHLTGALSPKPYPGGISLPGAGGKFDTAGAVQIWRGNTFVAHVVRPSPSFDAILALQERVKRSAFARFFTFLPAPSFHMTIFQGFSPSSSAPVGWPGDVPRDVGAATKAFAERLTDLRLPRFEARAVGLFCTNSLTMEGASPADEAVLRGARETLRDLTGFRPGDFDDYVFHLSMAYLTQWVTEATAREIVDFSAELEREFCASRPVIALEECAFCTFESMHHFEPVHVIPWQD